MTAPVVGRLGSSPQPAQQNSHRLQCRGREQAEQGKCALSRGTPGVLVCSPCLFGAAGLVLRHRSALRAQTALGPVGIAEQGSTRPGAVLASFLQEDRILIEGHERFGNKWTEIAKLVGGRTDNAVKNRWAALCKRTQRGLGGSKPAGGATRGRKRWDESESEDESSSSRSPSPAARNTPRTRNQLYNMGQTALQTWPLGALPNLALPMTLQLGPNPGGQAMLAKQPGAVDLQFPGLAGPLDLANPNLQWPLAPLGQVVSPRTRGAQQAQMLALPGAPPGMQEPSPPKRRSRPDLNVIIPAEPPLKDTTLGIHIVDSVRHTYTHTHTDFTPLFPTRCSL